MQRAVIYARYSSDKQTEDSIEAQLRACRDYASNKQYQIIDTYIDEAVSGKTANRTQYQKLLRDCEKDKFEIILIHKYDRIARNLLEHVTLEQKLKAKNILLIATAQDFGLSNEAKIMRSLVWSMSEYYNDNLAQETKKGLKETALKGLHTGGCPPFGYDVVNQKYVINDFEAIFVRKIFDCASKRIGFVDIIKEMEDCGVKGKRGKPIKYPQIYEMLRNEKYTGTFIYSPDEEKNRANRRSKPNAIRIENAMPQIISKEQFQEVQEIMTERKQTGKTKYLCSGLVYCRCGAKMHAVKSKRKGHEYLYYNCSKHCGAPVVHMEVVDNAAKDYPQVTAHHAVNVLRHLQQTENRVQPYEYRHIQHACNRPYQYERHENAAAQGGMVSRTVMQREYRAAADRQTEKDGDKEDHQRIRRPYRRQCIRTDALPYNQRIGYVIALLQQRTRHHRQGETQQRTRYATPGKVSVP